MGQLTDVQKKAISDHMTALNNMKAMFKTVTIAFNDMVINSVKLYWDNGQIAVVNRTMDTLQSMKGADNRALVSYYKKCIPAMLDKETGRFTKKNPKQAESMLDTWAEYILEKNWYELSKTKTSKPYDLDIAVVLKMVESRLTKGKEAETGDQVTNEKLDQLALGMNKLITKFAVEEQATETGDDEITDGQLADNIEKLVNAA